MRLESAVTLTIVMLPPSPVERVLPPATSGTKLEFRIFRSCSWFALRVAVSVQGDAYCWRLSTRSPCFTFACMPFIDAQSFSQTAWDDAGELDIRVPELSVIWRGPNFCQRNWPPMLPIRNSGRS